MKKRFDLTIAYDGFNGTKHIMADGTSVEEVLENMISEIEWFKDEFTNNNMSNGGNTAFTNDAQKLYDDCDDIINEIKDIIYRNEV